MDDDYNGIYTSQKRESKFPSIVYLDNAYNNYTVDFTGVAPYEVKWELRAESSALGMIINFISPNAKPMDVYIKGGNQLVDPNGYENGWE